MAILCMRNASGHNYCNSSVHSLWTWLWGRYHVPQNAFLVILGIYDLEENLHGQVFRFADDIKIFRCINDSTDSSKLQKDLDTVIDWAD